MKIIEPGHVYELDQLDMKVNTEPVVLRFVNREETETQHAGTQTQEVLRALIDRTVHCDNCVRWESNDQIIYHLRMALVLHEARHLERLVEKDMLKPERAAVGPDGHFALEVNYTTAPFEDQKAAP